MRSFLLVFLACLIVHTGAAPPSSGLNRTQRGAPCRPGVEYRRGNLCCLLCRAGTYVKSHCTTSGAAGQCEECDSGTYTEHDNELTKCLPCTQCRSDQELVKQCSHAEDAKCQCRPGRFCHPDEACEVCKKCVRCKHDEEVVRNCTSTTNTECKKVQSKPDAPSDFTVAIVVCVLLGLAVCVIVVLGLYKWRQRRSDPQPDLPDSVKAELQYSFSSVVRGDAEPWRPSSNNLSLPRQLVRVRPTAGVEEERERLCESLTSSASNSQHSLTGLPAPAASPMPGPRAGLAAPGRPDRMEEEFPKLVPLKGEESLRACFEYFEDLSMDYYRRFFRSLGISDNVIKSCDHQQYEDRIHELLNKWVEKEGRDASLNHLLRALLDLSQKLTAETIKDRALHAGHYLCEVQH
ncbi:tumor necrosis factor receptor superfamily member 10B-like isoform X1 [Salarias fasciatus]|uniref:Tumor necrosis factor receptor superfamily member 10B-like n=1 Tax=Salarias fasciatus TaxID=181472 RepID=A0A672GBV6_SALFA|nr:tumor necrosis factor receptor superfamily member 10B-like isoform X1 [Salarias fasciatus]